MHGGAYLYTFSFNTRSPHQKQLPKNQHHRRLWLTVLSSRLAPKDKDRVAKGTGTREYVGTKVNSLQSDGRLNLDEPQWWRRRIVGSSLNRRLGDSAGSIGVQGGKYLKKLSLAKKNTTVQLWAASVSVIRGRSPSSVSQVLIITQFDRCLQYRSLPDHLSGQFTGTAIPLARAPLSNVYDTGPRLISHISMASLRLYRKHCWNANGNLVPTNAFLFCSQEPATRPSTPSVTSTTLPKSAL